MGWCSNFAIYVADLRTYQLRHILSGYSLPITCMDWSSGNPSHIVCSSMDGTVTVWDVEKEVSVHTLTLDSPALHVQWCRGDPEMIAIASEDGIVRFWNPMASKSLVSREFAFSPVTVLRWSYKVRSMLASGHADCSIHVFNTANGEASGGHRIKCSDAKFGNHTDGVVDLQWDPLSDNYLIASFGSGVMALYDTHERVQVRAFDKSPGGNRCLEWLPTSPGSFLAASDKHGSIRQWNVSQNSPEASFKVGNSGIRSLRVLPGCNTVLVGASDGQIGLYNMRKKVWVHEALVGHAQTVFGCGFDPNNGNVLATCSYDGSVKMWDVSHMQLRSSVAVGLGSLYGLAWDPQGSGNCFVATSQGSVVVVHAENEGRASVVASKTEVHRGIVYHVAICERHRIIASAGADCVCALSTPGPAARGPIVVRHRILHPGAVSGCDFSKQVVTLASRL
jgi:WD40 repeat protein